MSSTQNVTDKVLSLREAIDNQNESIGEGMSQYQSEVALYGDAGPGQHPSLWLVDAEKHLADLNSKLSSLLFTPAGARLLIEEEKARAAYAAELDAEFSQPF